MFERPSDITDEMVVHTLRDHWAVSVRRADYAAVGFGSHHWLAGDHFVSVDAADDGDELVPALRSARALRDDARLEFVIAPIPSGTGELIAPLGDDWVMHVYERLEVVDDTRHGPHADSAVIDLVHRIHESTPVALAHARREDFSIGDRDDLEEALGNLDEPWETGPYGDRCREALVANCEALSAALARHDQWAEAVPGDGWVLTHGEPHRGNVFRTTRGWAVVDWDTALIAPAERDWWDIPNSPGDADLRDLYRFRWALAEVACYVSEFSDDHHDDRNTRASWPNFLRYLEQAVNVE